MRTTTCFHLKFLDYYFCLSHPIQVLRHQPNVKEEKSYASLCLSVNLKRKPDWTFEVISHPLSVSLFNFITSFRCVDMSKGLRVPFAKICFSERVSHFFQLRVLPGMNIFLLSLNIAPISLISFLSMYLGTPITHRWCFHFLASILTIILSPLSII